MRESMEAATVTAAHLEAALGVVRRPSTRAGRGDWPATPSAARSASRYSGTVA
jgi:hypothetical protein